MVLEQLVWSGSPSLGPLSCSGPCFPFRTCQATLGSRCSPIRLSDITGLKETLTPCKPQVGGKIHLTPTSLSQGSICHTQGQSQALQGRHLFSGGNTAINEWRLFQKVYTWCFKPFFSVTPCSSVMGYTTRAVRDTDSSLGWLGLFIIPILTIISYSHGSCTTYNFST